MRRIRYASVLSVAVLVVSCGSSSARSGASHAAPAVPEKAPQAGAVQADEAADRSACANGEGAACFRMGERASQARDAQGEQRYYKQACELHVGLACVHLGNGVEPDAQKRPDWLKKGFAAFDAACAKKDPEGCYYLAITFEDGVGTAQDLVRALGTYKAACSLGSLEACTNQAGMYLMGKGTKKDPAQAAALYAAACQRRDDRACYYLGVIHEQELGIHADESHIQKMQLGGAEVRVQQAKTPPRASAAKRGPAIDLLFKLNPKELSSACDAGQGLACYELGVMQQVGDAKLPKDDAKAVANYEKACNAGSGWGCLRAGDSYQRGYGVSADFAKAARFWMRVCQDGVGGNEGFKNECRNIQERMGFVE